MLNFFYKDVIFLIDKSIFFLSWLQYVTFYNQAYYWELHLGFENIGSVNILKLHYLSNLSLKVKSIVSMCWKLIWCQC